LRGTKREAPGDKAAQVRAKIDAYVFAIQAVLALEKIFAETLQAQARQGPRMRTTAGNTVTPDMTFEVAVGRFAGYRAVSEIKSRYPPRGRARRRLVRQLQQYDDIESGWSMPADMSGPDRRDYDLMLTVPTGHASDYVVNLPKDFRTGGIAITKSLCILGFEREARAAGDHFRTMIVHGRLSASEIEERLAEGSVLEAYEFLDELGGTKFCDSDPPALYTMSILWSYVFPNMIHDAKRRDLFQGKIVKVKAEAKLVHKLISRFAPPSNPQCIKASWVTTALDELVGVKLANKIGVGKYEIFYRLRTPPSLDWLIGLMDNANGNGAGARLGTFPNARDE